MSKLEELSSSVDEVWMQLAELLEHVEAIEQQLRKRDAMNLLMVRHVERLVKEKDQLARELAELRALSARPLYIEDGESIRAALAVHLENAMRSA
jgi:SMC interacting uncharacterized protein involved in chromosome segregation